MARVTITTNDDLLMDTIIVLPMPDNSEEEGPNCYDLTSRIHQLILMDEIAREIKIAWRIEQVKE